MYRTIIVAFALLFSQLIQSQEAVVNCKIENLQDSKHFKALQQQALSLNEAVCFSLHQPGTDSFEQEQNARFRAFAEAAKQVAQTTFAPLGFESPAKPFDGFIDLVSRHTLQAKQLPSFNVTGGRGSDRGKYVYYFNDRLETGKFSRTDNAPCLSSYNITCKALVDDFKAALDPYKQSYASKTANDTVNKLGVLSAQWDKFLTEARSQTMLDIALTTLMEDAHFKKGYLVGPPVRQWTLLHPSLVYEAVSDAPDGEQNKMSVAIEWFGVNWWSNNSPFFHIPFGISLASVYTDRAGVEDTGHGVMFHFNNAYSIGWSDRDGADGIYLSIDLLKAIEDKQSQFNRYKVRFSQYR